MKKGIALFCATTVLVAACILLVLTVKPADTTKVAAGDGSENTSANISESTANYKEITESVEKAKKAGIFVVSSSLEETFGLRFHGLGRDPLKSTDDCHSYEPGMWWEKTFFNKPKHLAIPTLLVPMDARATASPTGTEDYVFYRQGGWSWSIPYIAGLYALACQVEPEMTPDLFWEKALETGDTIKLENNGKKYDFGRIANPEKLINAFEK